MNRRHRKFLVATVVVAGMAAGISLWHHARLDVPAATMQQPFLPELAAKDASIARIEIVTAGSDTILQRQDDGWVLPQRNNYPADRAKIVRLLAGLAELNLLEAKTSDPARYAALGVDDPQDPSALGRLVRITDASGRPIVSVIIGRIAPSLGRDGGGLYVRRAGGEPSWLAQGMVDIPPGGPVFWTDRDLFGLHDAGSIQTVSLLDAGKPIVTIVRDHPDDPAYRIMPAQKALPDQDKMHRLASLPVSLQFDDFRPLEKDLAKAGRVIDFKSFAGMAYRLTIVPIGKDIWVEAEERGSGDNAAASTAFNTLHAHWLYKIPGYHDDIVTAQPADFVKVADDRHKH